MEKDDYLLKTNYEILALQETRHSDVTKMSAKKWCGLCGYTARFGKGLRNHCLRKKAAATVAQGGVGVPAKNETCPGMVEAVAESTEGRALYEQGRYKRVAIPIKAGRSHLRYMWRLCTISPRARKW